MPNVTLTTPGAPVVAAPTLSLQQLYARIDSKSFHTRSQSEIYAALDESGSAGTTLFIQVKNAAGCTAPTTNVAVVTVQYRMQ